MPITTTFVLSSVSLAVTTGSHQILDRPGWAVDQEWARAASTITNRIVGDLADVMGVGSSGYGLTNYLSASVNTSSRVTARGINTIISDLDLCLRHQSGATVTNTVTNLSTWTQSLVVNTGSQITATLFTELIRLTDTVVANRYTVNPNQLAGVDRGCDRVFDQGISQRTQPWGWGSTATVTQRVEYEWPRSYLANGFFNQGSELVIQPYMPGSYTQGLVNYGFQTYLDDYVEVPVSTNGTGGGRGPIYHVDVSLHPYGAARAPESTEYFWPRQGGPGVGANTANLSQNPEIVGTPFQLVGLHYGDYATKLVVGVRQGQSVPTEATRLRVSIDGGSNSYLALVPGYLDKYTGSTTGLSQLNGWWIEQYDYDLGQWVDRQVSWIEIWSGRKGQDPIGLQTAITDRQPHTISLVPETAAGTVNTLSTSNVAWANFITELRTGSAGQWNYGRDQWMGTEATTQTTWVSASNNFSVAISATREGSAGASRRLTVIVTATNAPIGSTLTAVTPVVSSELTCTAVASVLNSYDSAATEYTSGGGGGGRPWWLVGILSFFGLF